MKQHHLSIMLLVFSLMTFSSEMDGQFMLQTHFRPRFEFRDGYQKLAQEGSTPTVMATQRTRLMFLYNSDRLVVRFTPQDVRIWGDEQLANTTGVFGDPASLDLHEAYAEIRLLPSTWVSVGRQELVYDNQSLLSNRNWNQHGIASDAVVLKSQWKGMRVHAGGTWNTLKESSSNNHFPPDRLKTLSYLWINKGFSNGLRLSAIHISSGITETDTTNALRFRHTSGIYAEYRKNYTAINGNVYYQYGENQKGTPVSAWMADADLSRRFGILNAGIGLGYQSGNRAPAGSITTDKQFYDLYRAKHKFFGFMDYFTNIPVQTAGGGLADLYGYLDCRLSGKLSVKNTFHYFQTAQTNPSTHDKAALGYENDLIVSYAFATWGTLETGYLFMIPTESLKRLQGIKNDKFSQFGYVMLILNPVLFRN